MPTKEEVQQSLMEKMKDPGLSGDTFDELARRVKLLNEE